jgi:hypothetical protein
MLRFLNQHVSRSALYHLAGIHHQSFLSKVTGTSNIMGNEEEGKLLFIFELKQEIEDLQTNGDIQHRDWLIRKKHRRMHGQSAGYRHSLTLPTTELMRIFGPALVR